MSSWSLKKQRRFVWQCPANTMEITKLCSRLQFHVWFELLWEMPKFQKRTFTKMPKLILIAYHHLCSFLSQHNTAIANVAWPIEESTMIKAKNSIHACLEKHCQGSNTRWSHMWIFECLIGHMASSSRPFDGIFNIFFFVTLDAKNCCSKSQKIIIVL